MLRVCSVVFFAHSPIRRFSLSVFFFFFLFPLPHFPFPAIAATVAAVLDGDTIRLSDGRTVRYLGVNTPEYGQPFYEDARQYNAQLVLGKQVQVEIGGREYDGYGRELAYVYVGETLVNVSLITAGWGHVFVIDSFPHADEWLRLQQKAQQQRKGMWRDGVSGSLRITTVHADAAGDDRQNPNGEYVRLCNISDRPVALQGFALQDADRHRFVFPSGVVNPGFTVLVASGKGDTSARQRRLVFYWGAGPIWNNDKDTALLFDPSGKLIDSFSIVGKQKAPNPLTLPW
jgi:micrococcal nuclease